MVDAKAGDDGAFFRDQDQILIPHDLRDRRDHLGRQAGCDGRQGLWSSLS